MFLNVEFYFFNIYFYFTDLVFIFKLVSQCLLVVILFYLFTFNVDIDLHLPVYFSVSCHFVLWSNGKPLQYSCLENPRDRGA